MFNVPEDIIPENVAQAIVLQNSDLGLNESDIKPKFVFEERRGHTHTHTHTHIINSKIDAILIAKLSDEDTVGLEIIHGKQKFYAASMYFDYEEQIENKFNKLDEIMRFINGGGILIAADSNSRSKTWRDVINSRGRKLEEYLGSKQPHHKRGKRKNHLPQQQRLE